MPSTAEQRREKTSTASNSSARLVPPRLEYAGTELLDGALTHVWRSTLANQPAETLTIWSGDDDLPRRLRWESPDGTREERYRRIDAPLGIEPPTP